LTMTNIGYAKYACNYEYKITFHARFKYAVKKLTKVCIGVG